MARNMYGATSADFTLTSGGRVVPGATLTIWSARTGGTQIVDLLDVDSVATTTVTSDADGSIVYYGPNDDKTVHWADSGVGNRIAIRPVDITGDPPVLSIGTVGTGAAAASLTGTSEAPVLNLTLPSAGANGVNTAAIQDSAVTSAKIADGTIATADIADGAVTYAKLGADVRIGNLLTANQASLEVDTTGWAANSGSPTIARSTTQAAHGSASLKLTATATGTMAAAPSGTANYVPVVAGETYTVTASFYAETNARSCSVYVTWYTSGGSSISSSFGTASSAATGSWAVRTLTAVAPATAAFARVYLDVASVAISDVFYIDKVGFWKGASGVWTPPGSVVPGTSHIAVNGAYTTSGTAAPEGVVTAPPLSRYLQTSGAATATGAQEWVKATGTGNTGWIAGAEADTGWRSVKSAFTAPANGTINDFRLRRIGSLVSFLMKYINTSGAADLHTLTGAPPTGFVPSGTGAYVFGIYGTAENGTVPKVLGYFNNVFRIKSLDGNAGAGYIVGSYTTDDAWPNVLP